MTMVAKMNEVDSRAFLYGKKEEGRRKRCLLLIVPNKKGKIKSIAHPLLIFITFFVIMTINLYYLIRYPFRISEFGNWSNIY